MMKIKWWKGSLELSKQNSKMAEEVVRMKREQAGWGKAA